MALMQLDISVTRNSINSDEDNVTLTIKDVGEDQHWETIIDWSTVVHRSDHLEQVAKIIQGALEVHL